MSRFLFATLILVVIGCSGCSPGCDSDPNMITLLLPQGDIDAGRTAFVNLQCSACHTITGEEGLPEPVAKIPIPDLVATLAGQPRGAVASSLIVPSHIDAAAAQLWTDWSDQQRIWLGPGQRLPRTNEEGTGEPAMSLMSNYGDTMTVKQLGDLVAFLQNAAEERR